jgi:glyoxylase-like metal-dependent hydrolase (beta-lactamase superfamily II)
MIDYTIRPLCTGYQLLDKGWYSTFRRGHGQVIEHPVFAFLIEGGGRKILVDTGMSDTERSQKYHHDGRQDPGQAIHEHMGRLGIGLDEIEFIIFTHLHWDHCAYMKKFTKARYFVSEREYQFALNPIPFYAKSYEIPSLGIGCHWEGCHFNLIKDEEEIVEGIRAFQTPGHSPGHMAVSVQTEKGVYILAGDLFFLRENLEPDEESGWPFYPPGRFYNVLELWHSMEDVIRRGDYIMVTHDPTHFEQEVYP